MSNITPVKAKLNTEAKTEPEKSAVNITLSNPGEASPRTGYTGPKVVTLPGKYKMVAVHY